MNSWTKVAKAAQMAPKPEKKKRRVRSTKPAPTKAMCIVYGLTDNDGIVRYIGQTRNDLETRLNFHKRNAFTGGTSPCAKWIAENKADIRIVALDTNATWNVSEILWIDRYRREGHHLWNVTRGGDDTIADVRRENCFPASHEALRLKAVHERAEELGISVVQPAREAVWG